MLFSPRLSPQSGGSLAGREGCRRGAPDAVVRVEHARDAVEAEAVEAVLVEPAARRSSAASGLSNTPKAGARCAALRRGAERAAEPEGRGAHHHRQLLRRKRCTSQLSYLKQRLSHALWYPRSPVWKYDMDACAGRAEGWAPGGAGERRRFDGRDERGL